MIRSVPCTIDHMMEIRGDAREKNVAAFSMFTEWAARYLKEGPAIAAIETDDGRVLGCGGVRLLWSGTGEAWILLSLDAIAKSTQEQFSHYRKSAYTIAGDLLNDICGDLTRIQAHVRADDEIGIRFVERLGFVREGLMRKFGPDGSDHYLYAIVRG